MSDNSLHIEQLINTYNWELGAELGVRRGDFSLSLLKSNDNLFMYCIDVWEDDKSLNEKHNHKDNYNIFLKNTEKFRNRIVTLHMLTDNACNFVINKSLDFVFVDATHTYKSVKKDYMNWIPKLKDTGMLCGHDYCQAFDKGGVIRAVNELGNFIALPRGNSVDCNVAKTLELLKENKNVADLHTGCWFIWKKNINENV